MPGYPLKGHHAAGAAGVLDDDLHDMGRDDGDDDGTPLGDREPEPV